MEDNLKRIVVDPASTGLSLPRWRAHYSSLRGSTSSSGAGPPCRGNRYSRCSKRTTDSSFIRSSTKVKIIKERHLHRCGPNQQAIPAIDYLMNEVGIERWILEGTDYVYPRTTNRILEAYLKQKGVAEEDISINYTPFGHSDWQTRVSTIRRFGSAGKATRGVHDSTGDANVPFYLELANQEVSAEDIPVIRVLGR